MKKRIYITALAVLLMTALIFLGSAKNEAVSHSVSNSVAEMVTPVLDQVTDIKGLDVNLLIRKAAHLMEFAVLGALVMSLLLQLHRKAWLGYGCFYVLLVAVLDEYIQTFSDRSGKVEDVLLDLIGALLGFALIAGVAMIKRKKKGTSSERAKSTPNP